MDQSQRTAYLDAMGVTVWQPRVVDSDDQRIVMAPRLGDKHLLPELLFFASAENLAEDSAPLVESVVVDTDVVAVPVNEPSSKSVVSQPAEHIQAQEPVLIADEADTQADPDVAFTIQIQYHPAGFALLDICQHKLGHQRAHHDLGAAIVLALCGPAELEDNQFTWPVVNMPRMDRRRSQARSSTKAFLASFAQRCKIETLVCTGDTLDIIDAENLNILRLPFSLTDLLQGQISKRDAWQQLKVHRR